MSAAGVRHSQPAVRTEWARLTAASRRCDVASRESGSRPPAADSLLGTGLPPCCLPGPVSSLASGSGRMLVLPWKSRLGGINS